MAIKKVSCPECPNDPGWAPPEKLSKFWGPRRCKPCKGKGYIFIETK